MILAEGISSMAFAKWRYFPPIPILLIVLMINGCCILPIDFLHLLIRSCDFYPLFCECDGLHWSICLCWTIPVPLESTPLDHDIIFFNVLLYSLLVSCLGFLHLYSLGILVCSFLCVTLAWFWYQGHIVGCVCVCVCMCYPHQVLYQGYISLMKYVGN